MFNKLGTKGLLIAVIILAGIWLFGKYGIGDKKGTVRSVVVEVDTASLVGIAMEPKRLKGAVLEFERDGGRWTVRDSAGTYTVDRASLAMAISGFQHLRTLRLGGSMAKHAAKYELTDTARTSITFRFAEREPISVHCGLVNTEAREAGETFVNVEGEDDIHVIEGTITRALDQPTASWREHVLIGGKPAEWRKVQLRFGDGSGYELVRTGETWTIGGENTNPDRTDQFMKSLSEGRSSRYADNADVTGLAPVYSITIEEAQGRSVVVEVFDVGAYLVLIKRDRPDLKFWLDRERDMSRLYRPAEYLLGKPQPHPAH